MMITLLFILGLLVVDGRDIQRFVDTTDRLNTGKQELVDELLGVKFDPMTYKPSNITTQFDQWTKEFKNSTGRHVIYVNGPIHFGTTGDYLEGTWPSKSIIVVLPPRGKENKLNEVAIHISASGVGIKNIDFEVYGKWRYLATISRHEPNIGVHGLQMENVRITGQADEYVFGDFGAEVYSIRYCDFWNMKNGCKGVFETKARNGEVSFSNSTKEIIGTTLQMHPDHGLCLIRIWPDTHDLWIDKCNWAISSDIDATILVGDESLPFDADHNRYNLVGHVTFSRIHNENYKSQCVIKRLGHTALRDWGLYDFHSFYCGDTWFENPGRTRLTKYQVWEYEIPEFLEVRNYWNLHMPWINTRIP